MNNNEKCGACISLNEDCNALTFVVLLVKLLLSLLVIQINSYYFSEPTANCTFTDDSICYHHEKFYLSHSENLRCCSDPWKQHSKQIKSIYESLISKLLKN